ncbi:acyl-coenzyme A oxidase 3, peroxisomal-like [Impatiens glandulifera]|uniref:acyl-coenzyme A oxidase 3, peroxisomal-like n=1 Tax=Impatiens glandulifera TaxID=253017 RepID=UPI001FB1313C|nr:acyl-coenzyme A oxidase 3, peroxisomal-like [Impatiens glandulifera]
MESSATHPPSFSSIDRVNFRSRVLAGHFRTPRHDQTNLLETSACLNYSPPELSERIDFDTSEFRKLMDGHNLQDRDWLFGLMMQSNLYCPRERGGRVFVSPDYNQTMEQQRESTMKRIDYLREKGVFEGWLTGKGPESELRKLALLEVMSIYDHSLAIKVGVHFFLWGGAVQFFGTKPHHDKWLRDTEKYLLKGCFAMTELGHGSNVRGIETVATYDSKANEFVINTPCELAQKYWIGGAYR